MIQIVRLLDEALTNAVKHSGARRIAVNIETIDEADGARGRITVADDGKGFELVADGGASPATRPRAACAICRAAPRAAAQSWG